MTNGPESVGLVSQANPPLKNLAVFGTGPVDNARPEPSVFLTVISHKFDNVETVRPLMRGLHLDFDPRRRVEYLPARHGPETVPSDQSAFRFCWTSANRWGDALNGRSSENDGLLDVPVNVAVIAVLSVTIDCDAKHAICTEDGRPLSEWLELTVSVGVE